MPGGRPAKTTRSEFGERLVQVREQKGLSQKQVADLLGLKQQSYAVWERHPTALRPEQLRCIAKVLDTSLDYLLGLEQYPSRKGGPVGKVRQIFEQVSKLPRHQQEKILSLLEPFVAQHLSKNGH